MSATDIVPFFAFFLAGAASGRFVPGRPAWVIGLALPVAHFMLSIVTGRASEDLLTYVVPVNLILLGLAASGVLLGRSWRRWAGQRG